MRTATFGSATCRMGILRDDAGGMGSRVIPAERTDDVPRRGERRRDDPRPNRPMSGAGMIGRRLMYRDLGGWWLMVQEHHASLMRRYSKMNSSSSSERTCMMKPAPPPCVPKRSS